MWSTTYNIPNFATRANNVLVVFVFRIRRNLEMEARAMSRGEQGSGGEVQIVQHIIDVD